MRLSDELRGTLERMTTAYQWSLSPAGYAYLRSRGIQDGAIVTYRLGQVDGSFAEHASYAGWISLPYLTRLGGVVSMKFRRTDDGTPKYLGPYPTRLYNTISLDRAERLGYVAITEGEIKSIILDAYCGIPSVAVPGVEVWGAHPEWPELFRGFSRVLIFRDPDEPGEKLASRILKDIDTAQIVALPTQVDEIYLAYGVDEIRRAAGV
jgi:DNA primase